jgi:hypothetical protein
LPLFHIVCSVTCLCWPVGWRFSSALSWGTRICHGFNYTSLRNFTATHQVPTPVHRHYTYMLWGSWHGTAWMPPDMVLQR